MDRTVPFYRPDISDFEIDEVVATLKSGWLTSGPRVRRFEQAFAQAVGAEHAVAVNSCTAALHLAVEAMGLESGQAVLVPTMTFAATAEVVRYCGAIPVLVDCDPHTLNMDLRDAERKLARLRSGLPVAGIQDVAVVGIIPVHIGGDMLDMHEVQRLADSCGLWVVEDAAHAFPAAWRPSSEEPWQRCGHNTAAVSCFSFYANKTITTGEGGMAVTSDAECANRMRLMSLHGLSRDAWTRYSGVGQWDYRIQAAGYKYNLTDIAAALGIHQLARAEEMRRRRQEIAELYIDHLSGIDEFEMPRQRPNRLHSWHLFPVRLRRERLDVDRDTFLRELFTAGVAGSVHWRPLHLHPYYERTFGWRGADLPKATRVWEQLVSLPLFSAMHDEEIALVVQSLREICHRHSRRRAVAIPALGTAEHRVRPSTRLPALPSSARPD
jgi:perosamine synthetase